MATAAADVPVRAPATLVPERGRLFEAYAWVCLAIAVGGFVPSFWLPMATTGFGGSWLVVVHGMLFTGWTVLFLSQTMLVERGRIRSHRAWGVGGVSLASILLCVGLATAIAGLEARLEAGYGDRARAFTIVPVTSIALFFGFFAAAIANLQRPDWHKRLMMVATGAALVPALARMIFVIVDGRAFGATAATSPPGTPEIALRPALLVVLLLMGTAWADRRRRGSWHPAWFWGIGIFAAVSLLRVPVARTPAWYAFADWLAAFA